jgi:hypothetical protein
VKIAAPQRYDDPMANAPGTSIFQLSKRFQGHIEVFFLCKDTSAELVGDSSMIQ